MRKAILGFVIVAFVVAAAQPAGAIDDGFRDLYRVKTTEHSCPDHPRTHWIGVRYINERVRDYGRAGRYSRSHLEYVSGRWFPWQNDRGLKLRYRPRTDSAVGVRKGLQGCSWHVRLDPIGRGGPNALINSGFRGRYRIIARLHRGNGCPPQVTSYRRPIDVRYVNRWVRQFGHPDSDSARRFRYVRGAQFPWQHTRPWHHGERYTLRYHPATDSAVGIRHGIQNCDYRVRLIPIG